MGSSSDSEDELARSRVPDDDPRWQKVTYDNGVKKIILREGWGNPAPDGSDAYIRYVGKFKDSQRIFEDNTSLNPPFKFLVGHFRVIRAIDIAVAAMKIGEKCLLRTTSRYAFGEKGEGRKIAPNKDLDYELEVVDWNDWKRVNNKDEIYPCSVFSCGRHIDFMVNEDPTFPEGFHEALKSMNKYEIAEFKIDASLGFGKKGVIELGIESNATLYYRVQMHNYQNLMSRWKMEPLQLFDVGNRFKSKAREYFELGNWDYAMNRYEKALEYFEADEKMDNEEKSEAAYYISMVHNNIAMIHLKKYEFLDCIRECKKVIKYNDKNVKAWCRMGQSRMMLADYKQAHDDLLHALSLDADNKYIKRMLKMNKNKKKAYNQNQKNLYGGMFDRYNQAMKDKKAQKLANQQNDAPPSLNDVRINLGDIDDYDNENESSVGSIDFDFDDMDDDDDDDENKEDTDSDNNNDDDNEKNINSLDAIDEND